MRSRQRPHREVVKADPACGTERGGEIAGDVTAAAKIIRPKEAWHPPESVLLP